MAEPLSADALARMRAEHREESGCCAKCQTTPYENDPEYVIWPCDAALLLVELERYRTDGMGGWRSCNQFWIESNHA